MRGQAPGLRRYAATASRPWTRAPKAGTLTTHPVVFGGRHLFVNADAGAGELRVETLGADGKAVGPFTVQNCQALHSDRTRQRVDWTGAKDLARLRGKPVHFRFHLTKARLFSFWVSEESGVSHGYVAAGGPGFTGPVDN